MPALHLTNLIVIKAHENTLIPKVMLMTKMNEVKPPTTIPFFILQMLLTFFPMITYWLRELIIMHMSMSEKHFNEKAPYVMSIFIQIGD